MEKKPTDNLQFRPQLGTGVSLMLLFGLMLTLLFIAALFSQVLSSSLGMDTRSATLTAAVFQNVFAFILPAVIVAWLSGSGITKGLCIGKAPSLRAVAGIIIIFICAVPALNALVAWNESLHLPESMGAIEKTLREMEQNAANATTGILDVSSWGAMLAGVAIIGVLTGCGEELFFRAGLQNTLCSKGWVKPHIAIWTTAVIFSIMHMQFFGFVPRMLMGAYFGYILFWTGSVWNSVIAHAINNSVVVVTAWLAANGMELPVYSEIGTEGNMSWIWVTLSAVSVLLLCTVGRKIFFNR